MKQPKKQQQLPPPPQQQQPPVPVFCPEGLFARRMPLAVPGVPAAAADNWPYDGDDDEDEDGDDADGDVMMEPESRPPDADAMSDTVEV